MSENKEELGGFKVGEYVSFEARGYSGELTGHISKLFSMGDGVNPFEAENYAEIERGSMTMRVRLVNLKKIKKTLIK